MSNTICLGDAHQFEAVYRLYYAALCFFAAKYVSREEAQDIVENVFLRFWKQKKSFADTAHLQSSLYQSIKNACLDLLKIKARTARRYETLLQEQHFIEQDYSLHLIRTEVIAEIYRAIHKLPSQCSKIVYMGLIDGLNNQEIAKTLHLSVQTVKNQKSKALKILKQQFRGDIVAMITLIQLFL